MKSKYEPKIEHDIVVQIAFNKLNRSNLVLMPHFSSLAFATDLRSKKPDIIVYDREADNQKAFIYEVEVAESVNENSVQKWKEFYEDCKTLYLIVPEEYQEKADKLCAINGIIAIILVYIVNEEGKIETIVSL